MSVAPSVDTVSLSFQWRYDPNGPQRSEKDFEVLHVKLLFDTSRKVYEVGIGSLTFFKLTNFERPITCRSYTDPSNKSTSPFKETTSYSLPVTSKQIRNLTIQAVVSEKIDFSKVSLCNKIWYLWTGVTHETTVRDVDLKSCDKLVPGQSYRLAVELSANLSLSARIVKYEASGGDPVFQKLFEGMAESQKAEAVRTATTAKDQEALYRLLFGAPARM